MITTVITLVAFSDFSGKAGMFESEVSRYFQCELLGHDPLNPCDRSRFENIVSPALIVLSIAFYGMLPAVNLVFTISIQDMRKKCGMLCSKVKNFSTNSTKSTAKSREMPLRNI